MKTALCLSGHLRTFKHTFKSIRNNIIEPLNCDVFIHTWDIIGAPTGKNPGDINNENAKTIDFVEDVRNMFEPKSILIDDQKSKLDTFISQTNDIIVPKTEEQFIMKHIGLHVSMFYSLYMSNTLKKNHEEKNNFNYDLVIRCRPDLFIKDKLNFNMFPAQHKIYIPDIATYVNDGINDQFAVGCSKSMDKYCDIYHNIIDYYRRHACVLRPEVMIKYHLNCNNIPTESKNINYDMYRLDGSILKQHKMHAEWAPGNFLQNRFRDNIK